MNLQLQHKKRPDSAVANGSRASGLVPLGSSLGESGAQSSLQAKADHSSRVRQAVQWQAAADRFVQRFRQPTAAIGDAQPSQEAPTNNLDANARHSGHGAILMGATSGPVQAKPATVQRAKNLPSTKKKSKKSVPISSASKVIKKRVVPQKMTVRNKTNSYSSGLLTSTTRATGVKKGPRAEAQKVASFLGGSWVGGHMINDSLGGGGGYDNIVPITSSMNGRHKTIENQANNLLYSSAIQQIEYNMNILQRADVTKGIYTVKNLPTKFQQSIDVYPKTGTPYTITGKVLS